MVSWLFNVEIPFLVYFVVENVTVINDNDDTGIKYYFKKKIGQKKSVSSIMST